MQTTWAYISNYFVYSAMAVFALSFISHAFETAFAVRTPENSDSTAGNLMTKTLDYKSCNCIYDFGFSPPSLRGYFSRNL